LSNIASFIAHLKAMCKPALKLLIALLIDNFSCCVVLFHVLLGLKQLKYYSTVVQVLKILAFLCTSSKQSPFLITIQPISGARQCKQNDMSLFWR
jgi:hypothetical protein